MDSADEQLSAEGIDHENQQSSSSNLNTGHHDILGKIKSKRKPIFKLMKRSNINYSGPNHNRRNQSDAQQHHTQQQQQYSNSILNLPQNLSLEQKDSSINNNPSLNNLEDDDLFSFNGSFCQSPPFGYIKDCPDNIQLSEQLSDIKISTSPPLFNSLKFSNFNIINPALFQDEEYTQAAPQMIQNQNDEMLYKQTVTKKGDKQISAAALAAGTGRQISHSQEKKKSNVKKTKNIENTQEEQDDIHNMGFDNELSHSPFDTESIQHNNNDINNNQSTNERNISPSQIDQTEDKKQLQQQQYSRREKSLEELSKKFLTIFLQKEQMLISLDKITQQLDVERRRIYDIINILESLKLVTRRGKNNYKWNGFEQIFDTIQFFSTQSEKQDMSLLLEQNEKKEKSLEILSIGFLKLFLNYKQTLSLEEAARKLSPNNSENQKIKTKIRRLYDIANVFKSLGLIKKVQLNETKKPAFQWVGISGLQDFYNSSKDKQDIDVNVEMEETKKTTKANKKEQVSKQKSISQHNNPNQDDQKQIVGDSNDHNFQVNTNEMNQLLQSLENVNNNMPQLLQNQPNVNKSPEPNQQNSSDKQKDGNSQIHCGFLSSSKNSAFKRVSKSLTETLSQQNSLNNKVTKKLNLTQTLTESPLLSFANSQSLIGATKLDTAMLEEETHSTQTTEIENNTKQRNTVQNEHQKLLEERELTTLLEKMKLHSLISDKTENSLQSVFSQNGFSLNSSNLGNQMNLDNTNLNNLQILNTNNNNSNNNIANKSTTDAQTILQQLSSTPISKIMKSLPQQKQQQLSQHNSIFNSKNSAFNSTNKKKLIEDKGINPINSNSKNFTNSTLMQLLEPLNSLNKQNKFDNSSNNGNNNQNNNNMNQSLINQNVFNSNNNSSELSEKTRPNKALSSEMVLEQPYVGGEEQSQNSLFNNQNNRISCLENVVRNQIFKNTTFSSSFISQNLSLLLGSKDKQNLFLQLAQQQTQNIFKQQQQDMEQDQSQLYQEGVDDLNNGKKQQTQQQQLRKQSLQQSSESSNKKELSCKKKQKLSIDRYNQSMQNSSHGSFKESQENSNIGQTSPSNNQTIPISANHKKEKFKTKSNSLYDDRKTLKEEERFQELAKLNKEEDHVFYSPNKVMQCIKKRKKGQEEMISTSVSSNQSSDSKIHQIPQYSINETFHFQAPMQPSHSTQKNSQIIQQLNPLQVTNTPNVPAASVVSSSHSSSLIQQQ